MEQVLDFSCFRGKVDWAGGAGEGIGAAGIGLTTAFGFVAFEVWEVWPSEEQNWISLKKNLTSCHEILKRYNFIFKSVPFSLYTYCLYVIS